MSSSLVESLEARRRESLLQLRARVLLHGLIGRPDLNTKTGVLVQWLADRARWVVEIDGSRELVRVKANNLTGLAESALAPRAEAGALRARAAVLRAEVGTVELIAPAPAAEVAPPAPAPSVPTVERREAFRLIDKNGNGRLSRAEVIQAVRRDAAVRSLLGLPATIRQEDGTRDVFEKVFQAMDSDDSKEVDFDEFERFLGTALPAAAAAVAPAAAELLDAAASLPAPDVQPPAPAEDVLPSSPEDLPPSPPAPAADVHPSAPEPAAQDVHPSAPDGVMAAAPSANGKDLAIQPGQLRAQFMAVVDKYGFDQGAKSDEIADFVESHAHAVTCAAFAARFGTSDEDADTFLTWLNVGLAFREQYLAERVEDAAPAVTLQASHGLSDIDDFAEDGPDLVLARELEGLSAQLASATTLAVGT